ncbi:NUDIX domain-containing protein [Kribbella sp. NPDC056345]|uniref:NUDIX domain-containing protein n=1 Tax=Kribbella sp. NPDC056345 TaxID=3345789 RepID=UPI0035E09B5F
MTVNDDITRMPRKRLAAAVLIRDHANRVLLLEPTYKLNWELPGGIVEADESPWTAASREVAEELGLHLPLGRLLVVDHVHAHDDRPDGINFIFDGGHLATVPTAFPDGEIRAAHFHTVAEAHPHLKPQMAGRITAALQAAAEGTTLLCNHGVPVA